MYIRASLNWDTGGGEAKRVRRQRQIGSDPLQGTGMRSNGDANWIQVAHQEEHPRLHDLSGEFHEGALLQEHLHSPQRQARRRTNSVSSSDDVK